MFDTRHVMAGLVIAVGAVLASAPPGAHADPAPGFSLDPVALEARMQSCLSYAAPESAVLMAWVNVSTGRTRTWRCSSLRHMLFDDLDRPARDPFSDIPNFMRCADRAVSYGFPAKGDPGNRRLILNQATPGEANVIVNELSGDIASIYTTRGTWAQCAAQL